MAYIFCFRIVTQSGIESVAFRFTIEDLPTEGDEMGRNIPIKVARAEHDMTQKALAEAVGISRQTMNAIEQGEYNPTIRLCRAICKVLGKTLDELFGEGE